VKDVQCADEANSRWRPVIGPFAQEEGFQASKFIKQKLFYSCFSDLTEWWHTVIGTFCAIKRVLGI